MIASAISATAQNYDITFYTTDPSVDASTAICKISSGFSSGVESTLKTNANKLISVAYSDVSALQVNQTFTSTVKGNTGTIAAGGSINMYPATNAKFDSARFQLTSTSYQCDTGDVAAVVDNLKIASAAGCSNYTAIFTFTYLSTQTSNALAVSAISPIMQIPSGGPIKHTDTPTFTIASINPPSLKTNGASSVLSTSATLNGVINAGTFTGLKFCTQAGGVSPGANFTLPCTAEVVATSSGSGYINALTGLTPSTTYYFEFKGISGGTTYQGGVKSFTTPADGVASFTVTFDPNGGTLESGGSVTITTGGEALADGNKPATDPTKSGYSFVGWNTDQNADVKLNSIIVNSAKIIYAIWTPNKYIYDANTGTGGPTNQFYAGTTLKTITNSFTAPSGYTFDGWCTSPLDAGVTDCSGADTKYLANIDLANPSSTPVTLYAIWKTNSSPAQTYTPRPPVITGVSASEVCAVGSQLTLRGINFSGASVTVDNATANIVSSNAAEIVISLPDGLPGNKSIKVTNADGSATATIKYSFLDRPVYVNVTYPEMFKDMEFSHTFNATDAKNYSIIGSLPAGLVLNAQTGEISGIPTVNGDFTFTIEATNICASAYLNVKMQIDKAIPDSYSCLIEFRVRGSDNISEYKLAALKNCLDKVLKDGPASIDPIIFLSGGVPKGLTDEELLNHPRYLRICELLNSLGIIAQIIVGSFDGPMDQVQIMIYWPEPNND
ncbi:MAG: InlB B-repeat-containing protein [Candidatus Nanopelagicaceae bacterium]